MNVFLLASVFLLLSKSILSQKSICKSPIYCQGDLLRVVQMAGIFKDSKTFVDMSLIKSVERTLKNFDRLMGKTQGNPGKNDIVEFVQNNFQASTNELDTWYPTDYQISPPFLRKIRNMRIRGMAKRLLDMWPVLGRKIKPEVIQNSQKYSIIPLPNGFIVPGGRFREIYYWDSYWIIKGIVESYGFIPNGGRIYYLDRSQPPLLTFMVAAYLDATNDIIWLRNNIQLIEKELNFWLTTKTIQIDKGGRRYQMARYQSSDDSPRPESYIEDVHTASRYRSEDEKRQCYMNLRTGAETGWDFSGRWFFDGQGGNQADLSTIKPTRIIPVDLNAILCRCFLLMHDFYIKLREKQKALFWLGKHLEFKQAIKDVLYNQDDGIWYDYDIELRVQRKHFYPSNFAPLWCQAYDAEMTETYAQQAVKYLKMMNIMSYEGGIPASLFETGEQWDFPNAWPPSQSMVILGLENTKYPEAQKTAHQLAMKWIESMIKVAEETQEMFEKYSAVFKGMYGGGGEYEVQTGFGWTNGVVLELIELYFINKKDADGEQLPRQYQEAPEFIVEDT
ncbi:trehalase-like isoform X2 [Zophobas morio]|uniref:trehalase-like isoform X2 n=1 Tax=Zophobas morio TaxID=2755281 RepID=UPI003082C78F